ncbi:FAD-dependent oxidoreductase [Patulibacter defluvii]|uniref:FAD-dependent oxidoreductase n=1 Tax=Patulibacter defluvii TaxID=3095358 RepID=UPI002A74E3DD|nr:FAD-dependent oxidoreductase [Patulibacter sp. DM4]
MRGSPEGDPPLLDVVIVGAGAAGCSAAARLAAAGLEVVLVDGRREPPPDADLLLSAAAVAALRETPGLERLGAHDRIDAIDLRIPGRPARAIPEIGAFAIGRDALHDALFHAATMSEGVRLRADTATAIVRGDERWEVTTAETRTPIWARHLIVASGGAPAAGVAPADAVATRDLRATAVRCGGDVPAGAGMVLLIVPPDPEALHGTALSVWAVPGPLEGTVTVRVAAGNLDRDESDERLLERGLDALRAEVPELGPLTPLRPAWSGPLDSGFTRQRVEQADGLLIGDAAGLVNPFSGEGLSYALESAALAARAILSHRDDPAAAQQAYARRVAFSFLGNFETSQRAVRRDHLTWRMLSDAADSGHPFLAKGRRAILLPEGLAGATDPLRTRLDPELAAVAGPFLLACDEVLISTIRNDWPFLARMAITGTTGEDERLRPALMMLGAALAAGATLDARYATLAGGLELAMLGALGFLGTTPDDGPGRGLDWAETSAVVGGDFLLGQAARLVATFGPEVSRSFSEWLIDLATLRARRVDGDPTVSAADVSATLHEFPARIGAELAGADDAAATALRDFGGVCGEAFLHADEVLGLTGDRTRLDTTFDFMTANRMATDGDDDRLERAREMTRDAESRARAALATLPENPGRRLLEAFAAGVCEPGRAAAQPS